jgi:hypothetical protein
MLPRYLFWTILLLTCGYALWKGRSDERMVAAVCLMASLATKLVISPLTQRYKGVETGLLVIDLLVLSAFLFVALRSTRFWPLWVAGLQLTTSTSHVLKSVEIDLMPQAYAAAAIFWSYPILLILAIGTWRGCRREREEKLSAPHPGC